MPVLVLSLGLFDSYGTKVHDLIVIEFGVKYVANVGSDLYSSQGSGISM